MLRESSSREKRRLYEWATTKNTAIHNCRLPSIVFPSIDCCCCRFLNLIYIAYTYYNIRYVFVALNHFRTDGNFTAWVYKTFSDPPGNGVGARREHYISTTMRARKCRKNRGNSSSTVLQKIFLSNYYPM